MAVRTYKDQLSVKKRKRKLLALLTLLGAVFLLCVAIIYCLFFSNYFNYQSIILNGPSEYKEKLDVAISQWLNEKHFYISNQTNSFVFPIKILTTTLLQQFPQIETIDAEKLSPHDFKIYYTAKQPFGVWCLLKQNKCYYFDKNAIIFAQTEASEGFLLTRIDDDRERIVNIGSMIMSNDWMEDIFSTIAILKTKGIIVSRIYISQDSINDIDFITQAGWKILVSTATNVKGQINAMITLYDEKLSLEQKSKLEYIDLRIQDRIYYK